mgnify:CR=1 FL=1
MWWLASPGVYDNESNANFGPGAVNDGEVGSGNNMFNSNGNSNENNLAVRPVASINCGYIVINCIRDNIETNYCPLVRNNYKQKIDKYTC